MLPQQPRWYEEISIHALREEGDRAYSGYGNTGCKISIHALREEGDEVLPADTAKIDLFLSTPSARRATEIYEKDKIQLKFLSTPSARRATKSRTRNDKQRVISIHALREEGDQLPLSVRQAFGIFLSTPSARRATAKTETKSLFSYKLYNILHEFRRALIYNGSKNYPNHAK